MVERIIFALLYIGGLAIAYYTTVWFLGVIGLHIPAIILSILMAMFVLVAILVLYRLFMPVAGRFRFWPRDPV